MTSVPLGPDTHCDIEKLWGEQVPEIFKAKTILGIGRTKILAAKLPDGSNFADLDFGTGVKPLLQPRLSDVATFQRNSTE